MQKFEDPEVIGGCLDFSFNGIVAVSPDGSFLFLILLHRFLFLLLGLEPKGSQIRGTCWITELGPRQSMRS